MRSLRGVLINREYARLWAGRNIMLRSELVRAVLVVALLALSLVPADALPVGLWLGCIYLTVLALNAAGQGQATTGAAAILGPPLAAPLLFAVGIQWAMLINAASYVSSYLDPAGHRALGTFNVFFVTRATCSS